MFTFKCQRPGAAGIADGIHIWYMYAMYNKAQQCLQLLRNQKIFNINKEILTLVYPSLIESILTFNISSWYNLLTSKHKTRLSHISGSLCTPISELYKTNYFSCHLSICYKHTEDCTFKNALATCFN